MLHSIVLILLFVIPSTLCHSKFYTFHYRDIGTDTSTEAPQQPWRVEAKQEHGMTRYFVSPPHYSIETEDVKLKPLRTTVSNANAIPFPAPQQDAQTWFRTQYDEGKNETDTVITITLLPEWKRVEIMDSLFEEGIQSFDLDRLNEQIVPIKPESIDCYAVDWELRMRRYLEVLGEIEGDKIRVHSTQIPPQFRQKHKLCKTVSGVYDNLGHTGRAGNAYIYCQEVIQRQTRYHVFNLCEI